MIVSSELLLAVLVASVMGSLHCVGMCGPFALMASGTQPASGSAAAKATGPARLAFYHLGRLLTYVVAGAIAGSAGAALSAGGEWFGVQSAAARVAGLLMIAIAIVRLTKSTATVSIMSGWGKTMGGLIAKTRPTVNRFPSPVRSFVAGSLTTLLPCGWLYLFLLVAAGTGGAIPAVAVMVAFWIGTVPALSLLVLGALRMAPRLRGTLPVLGSLLLLITGLYTATGRAATDFSSLTNKASSIHALNYEDHAAVTLDALEHEPLPCCVGK